MMVTGSSGVGSSALSGGLVGKRRYPSGNKHDSRFR